MVILVAAPLDSVNITDKEIGAYNELFYRNYKCVTGNSSHVSRSGRAGSQLITIHCNSICLKDIVMYLND